MGFYLSFFLFLGKTNSTEENTCVSDTQITINKILSVTFLLHINLFEITMCVLMDIIFIGIKIKVILNKELANWLILHKG